MKLFASYVIVSPAGSSIGNVIMTVDAEFSGRDGLPFFGQDLEYLQSRIADLLSLTYDYTVVITNMIVL